MKKAYVPKKHIFTQECKQGTYWRGRITYGYDENKKPIIRTFSSYDREEMERRLNEAYEEALLEADRAVGKYFKTYLYNWFEHVKKKQLAITTYTSYKSTLNTCLKDAPFLTEDFGHLHAPTLQAHVDHLYEKGVSLNVLKSFLCFLGQCYTYAMNDGAVKTNPAKLVVLPREPHTKPKVKYFSLEEQQRILSQLEDTPLDRCIRVLLGTGLRISELLGLTWDNFTGDTLRVEKQLIPPLSDHKKTQDEQTLFSPPKSKASIRDIPITATVSEALKSQKIHNASQRLYYGPRWNPHQLIFPNKKGHPYSYRYVSLKISTRFKEIGVPPLTAHALRHTYATRLIEAGVALDVIQRLLGHSNCVVTSNIYTHVSEDRKREALEKVAAIF